MRLLRFLLTSFVEMTILAVLFLQPLAFAAAPVTVTARAVPSTVTIGDEIRLLVQVDRPRKYAVSIRSDELRLDPFEVKRLEISPFVEGKNRVRETFIIVLTVFELGDLQVPPVIVQYKDEAGRAGTLLGPPVPVKVVSVGKKAADKDDIRPIKGPVSLSLRALRVFLLSLLAALLSALLAVKVTLRIRHQRQMDLESRMPAHQRAMLELERLQKKGLTQAGRVKEHYSELADILRRYLERRFEAQTLEMTSFEILTLFKEKKLERSLLDKMEELLRNADLVKFAKYAPPRSLTDDLTRDLKIIVDGTTPKEAEKQKIQK
ncbi:MAG: hypothetical protein ACREH5_00320 [Candidatus Omnitrophota bacterium]